jgi:hypothetical protein
MPCTASPTQPRVVVVIAGSASIRDFADPSLPGFAKLFNNGSAALMNVRAGRPSHDSELGSKSGFEAGCVSLGASAMATGGAEVWRAGDANGVVASSKVITTFEYRTNANPGSAQVLHTEIARMRRINEAASYRAKPGSLGSALRKSGIRTAVLGNSDIPGEIHREAVAAAMDGNGIVDYGEVDGDKVNRPDPTAPYGIRANTSALLRRLDDLPPQCRFIVIDFGDTFRADTYAESCTDKRAAEHRKSADARLSSFVGDVAGRLDPARDLLIVLSPNARSFSEVAGERMGAILISGPGFGQGRLTSASTRRPGVVTLGDVAPTILAFFGVKPTVDMVGRPITSLGGPNAAEALVAMNADASAQADRQVIMRGASVAQSVMVVIVLAAILLTISPLAKRIAAWLIPCFAALPLVMLLMPLLYSGGMIASAVALVVLTLAILGLSALTVRTPGRAFVWLCAIDVAVMMVDLLRGAPLMVASIASYNIVEGARYYGIGNELMGTMLGATVVGVGMALAKGRIGSRAASYLAAMIFGVVLIFVAAPTLGAKVGGALAMTPAMATALLARRGWRPSVRGIAFIVLITVLAVGAMFAGDALHSGSSQSHAGRTVGMLAGGNAAGILDIFQRKLALNFALISGSLWSRLLGLCLAGSAVLLWWGKRCFGNEFLGREESAAALGCCVGAVAAFLFNDSGVVAGATCSVFLFALLALKLLGKPLAKS